MIPVLSREQMRAFDRLAIEGRGVPSLTLMENAGRGAARVVARAAQDHGRRVVIVAGPGNNGGDAFVVARRLRTLGLEAEVYLTAAADRLSPDARVNYDALCAVGGAVTVEALSTGRDALAAAIASADVLVDGLLGTGLDRDVTGALAEVLVAMNAARAHRVALDVPSGLCADTGRVLGVALSADETVTFAHPTRGLLTPGGADYVGRLEIADIGVPGSLADDVGFDAELPELEDVRSKIAPRLASTHKGASGRVVVIAGSPGKTGAALLAGRGALRGGAGLVTLATHAETARALDGRVLELMTAVADAAAPGSLDGLLAATDSVVIGPGLGLDARGRALVDHVVLGHPGRVVADADALTHLAGRLRELRGAPGRIVLTPHPGELGRLLDIGVGDVEADRFSAVRRAVELSGATVLLKGAYTLVGAPGRRLRVNPTGNAALATGGSGDVLSGLLGALLVSIDDPADASIVAAYVHGLVADRWSAETGGDRGLLAREIADGIPRAIGSLVGRAEHLPRGAGDGGRGVTR